MNTIDKTTVNISEIAKESDVNLTIKNMEKPEDANARRALEADNAKHQRRIQMMIVYFSMAITATIFVGCVYTFAQGSADDKKWAAGILSSICSGLIGYLVGQNQKK